MSDHHLEHAMQAVGYYQSLPIDNDQALLDLDIGQPQPGARDLLVRIEAIAVNPVDSKIRRTVAPQKGQPKILGFDAAGTVEAVGSQVELFEVGDTVWYSGVSNRPGSNAELQCVDERLVGSRPGCLDAAEAAAMPLTLLTAWELLFQRLEVPTGQTPSGQTLLIVGAAGGVGSIATQLASQLTGLIVIGSASRPETQDWVRAMGADHVVDHGKSLTAELARLGAEHVHYIASLTHTREHFDDLAEVIAPQGKIGLLDDPGTLEINKLKRKSASLHWEYMFARPLFETDDMVEQHRILTEAARLVEGGVLKSHMAQHYGSINATNLKRAHAAVESGHTRGKIVLEGFD